MRPFASVADVAALFRAMTADEQTRCEALLPLVSDELRQAAKDAGKDLDGMIMRNPSLASVAKIVTVDAVSRVLRQSTTDEPMSQESQSGLGYSWSGTYAIPGGGISNAIMKSDLKRLGIIRQQVKAVRVWPGSPECR